MDNELKIKRCNFLPEGEMAIIKDTNTLIHNIVDSELKEKDKEIEKLTNTINELEKELDNLIIFNQSNITCNHYTPDDWKDSKLIGNMLYKMKPVSFLAQELKDKLKALKEGE